MKHISPLFVYVKTVCWTFGLSVTLLSSCSKQAEFEYIDEATESEVSVITVTGEDGNESLLAKGSVIGVYVTGVDGSVTLKRTVVGEGGEAALPSTASGGSVGMVAYTPYKEDWGEAALYDGATFTVSSDQSTSEGYRGSDLMIGSAGQITRARSSNTVTMHHVLARVAIHIVDETGRINLDDISAELLNVNNTVTVSLKEQSVSTISTLRDDIRMYSGATTDWRVSSYAIVAPQTVTEGTSFYAVTLYGNREIYPIPATVTLEGGKTYTINMRLTSVGLILDGWSITDWLEEGEEELEAAMESQHTRKG